MLVTTMVGWAGGVVVARSVHELVPPIGFSFWRWFTAALLLTPFVGAQLLRDRHYIKRHFHHFALLGLCMAGASTILVWALQYTTATNVTLMSATQPIATAIVAWLLLRERLAPAQLIGVSAAMSGIVIMVTRMDVTVIIELSFNPGDVLVIVAVVFYACYSVNLHRWVSDITPLMMMYMTCLGGTIILLPAYLVESVSIRTMPPDPRVGVHQPAANIRHGTRRAAARGAVLQLSLDRRRTRLCRHYPGRALDEPRRVGAAGVIAWARCEAVVLGVNCRKFAHEEAT